MNVRHFLKCEVCGSIILVRTQLGWLDGHPIRVHCGKCGILISGKVILNQEDASFRFEFNNAECNDETDPDFYIESSGELLTEKIQVAYFDNEMHYTPAPFFQAVWAMGDEGFEEFKEKTIQFVYQCKLKWPHIRRINELWLNGKTSYLVNEVKELLPEKQFPMNNELEYLRGVHTLNLQFFDNIFKPSFFTNTTQFLWNQMIQLSDLNARGLIDLVRDFGENGLLKRYNEKIFLIMNLFIERFQYLIPVYGLQFYKDEAKENVYENKGITTASFEDLKQFYLDCYESLSEISRLVVAFNNLKLRNDYKVMAAKRKDIVTISDYDQKAKGIRITYISGSEDFDIIIGLNLDNKIRNAIGHNTYKYNGFNQIVTYYPSGCETQEDENKLYLVEFCQKCLNIFQSLLTIAELVYQSEKLYYITKGYKPIDPSVFKVTKKVGRNDPCPCGSEKKYKKCCGLKI